ncbi:MAG TPA: 3',5'-nucleoside bisphosphate phosphatase [Burkholderiaceae bacterium]|nr:3',5'-nucleoside bisphosphate phosphatase [Burkholderiaceae bacterium]
MLETVHAVRADLHSHSFHSDGTMAPGDVVRRAADQGVELYALTDHDEVAGLAEATAAAAERSLAFVPGVEVSVTWGNTTVHIVGLGIDSEAASLRDRLAYVRSGRMRRAQEINAGLSAVGIDGALEGALRHAENPRMIGRTHFARFLVEQGVCRDVREVFKRYMVDGKPGYVPHRWASLTEAVDMIAGAGGVAVVAHPARYRFDDLALHTMLEEFRDAGGEALEVVTSNHTPDDVRRFTKLALEFGFEASSGSDFHGPGESANVELGRVASLAPELTPVWHRFL